MKMTQVDDQLRGWVAAYLTNTLDEVAAQSFQRRLEQDKAARQYFAQQAQEDVLLRQCLEARSYKQIQVERSSQKRRSRSKISVRHQSRRRRRASRAPIWGIAAAAAAVLCIIIFGMQSQSRTHRPATTLTHHEMILIRSGQGVLYQATGEKAVRAGDKIEEQGYFTTNDQVMRLGLSKDATEVEVQAQTEISVQVSASDSIWKVKHGAVLCHVAKQKSGHAFYVRGALGEVKVIGTQFSVRSDPQTMHVAVTEGIVDVREFKTQKVHRLHAGDELMMHAHENIKPVEQQVITKSTGPIQSLSLIDAATNKIVPGYEQLTGDIVLERDKLNVQLYNIRVNTDSQVTRLSIHIGKNRVYKEQFKPFAVFRDDDGDYDGQALTPGRKTIRLQAFRKGQKYGQELTFTLTIK